MHPEQIQHIFSSNRTEELGYDVWESFVVSPKYENLGISTSKKPRVIVGGRGCGKTMLLRYLAHESTFSKNRSEYPANSLQHIGLYWRADTQFASLLDRRGLTEDIWKASFEHLCAIVLGAEILRSLESICHSDSQLSNEIDLSALDLSRLKSYNESLPSRHHELLINLEDRLATFETWANDVKGVDKPAFLPGVKFLKRLLNVIREQLAELSNTSFYVYIDEYENLSIYQQEMVNTWLKHSEPPLIFNLAMKRNGFKTRNTAGGEALSDIHDYREIDLEEFDRKQFEVFAAEVLLSRIDVAGGHDLDIDVDILRDPNRIQLRKQDKYTKSVINLASMIFASQSYESLAKEALDDKKLASRLESGIREALNTRSDSTLDPSFFISSVHPDASIVVPALLHRERLSVALIEEEFKQLLAGKENKFSGPTGWIHNNLVGCYLRLFEGLGRPCPIYSGFHTFCHMSKGNLRHFLELCHQAVSRSSAIELTTTAMQAEAARQVATDLLSEIRSFGLQGNNLHAFVLRLGLIFTLSQQRPSQSEPEISHFSVKEGGAGLSEKCNSFLSEAVKWSVLYEEKVTKKKGEFDLNGIEYILNPIYAPYFHISHRKIRRLELRARELETLVSGDYADVRNLVNDFQSKWSLDLNGNSLPLFAHLSEEPE